MYGRIIRPQKTCLMKDDLMNKIIVDRDRSAAVVRPHRPRGSQLAFSVALGGGLLLCSAYAYAGVAGVKAGEGRGLPGKVIGSSTIMRGGKAFPKFAPDRRRSTDNSSGASCEPYDTMAFTQGAKIDLEGGNHVKKTVSYPSGGPQQAIYSPPNSDWLVQSYSRVVTTAGAPYTAADSAVPAGYSFSTASNYSSVINTMHSYVLSLNVPDYIKADLNAQVSSLVSNIQSYGYSLGASHGSVDHSAQVWGTGIVNTTTGHAWYHGYIDGSLICAPAYLHDQNLLTTKMKAWVNGVVASLPITDRVVRPAQRIQGASVIRQ